jgi:hypothetical protein
VDGLQAKYGNQIAFLRVDVSTPEGLRAFDAARLSGHPSFLILKPDGTEAWRAVGQQTETALLDAIKNLLPSTAAPG